jgi:hypothetical protein
MPGWTVRWQSLGVTSIIGSQSYIPRTQVPLGDMTSWTHRGYAVRGAVMTEPSYTACEFQVKIRSSTVKRIVVEPWGEIFEPPATGRLSVRALAGC